MVIMRKFYYFLSLLSVILGFAGCRPEASQVADFTPNQEQPQEPEHEHSQEGPNLEPIRVLSLDGGGIRGLIATEVLSGVEKELGKPLYQIFDLFSGTSTGGLMALMLTTPHAEKSGALMTAQEVQRFYLDRGKDIFKGNFLLSRSARSLVGNIYDASGLESLITELGGERKYSTSLKPRLLTGFDIVRKIGIHFNSDDKEIEHLTILEVARATSAAPTYFAPKVLQLKNFKNVLKDRYIVDGGLYKNNPSVLAYRRAIEIFGEKAVEERGLQLVSIGTGVATYNKTKGSNFLNAGAATWAPAIIDGIIDGSVDEEHQVMKLIAKNKSHIKYFRLQAKLRNKNTRDIVELDNIAPQNMQNLIDAGASLMKSKVYAATIQALKQK